MEKKMLKTQEWQINILSLWLNMESLVQRQEIIYVCFLVVRKKGVYSTKVVVFYSFYSLLNGISVTLVGCYQRNC